MTPEPGSLYDKGNDAVRVDTITELDEAVAIALRTFLRRLGVPYLYEERIIPTLNIPDSSIYVAVRDRPWPPWGHGSRRIVAMMQVFPISSNSFGLSPVYVAPEDNANIGLRAALYKETLEGIARRGTAEINYLVIDGAVLGDRTLRAAGFKRTSDLVQTEEAKYHFYRGDVATVLSHLHLDKVSIPALLSHQADQSILDRNTLFQGALDWARTREIVPIDAGAFEASLPGGVPNPPPPPPSGSVDLGDLGIIVEQQIKQG